MREETGLLDSVANAAAERDGILRGVGFALDADFARGWGDECVDGSEKGGFAGATAAEESGCGRGLDGKGDVAQDRARLNGVGDVCEFDCGDRQDLAPFGFLPPPPNIAQSLLFRDFRSGLEVDPEYTWR